MTTRFSWADTPNMIEFSPLPIDLLLAKQRVAKFRLTHHLQIRARPIIVVRDTPLLTSAFSEKAHLFGRASKLRGRCEYISNTFAWDRHIRLYHPHSLAYRISSSDGGQASATPINKRHKDGYYFPALTSTFFGENNHTYLLNHKTNEFVQKVKAASRWHQFCLLTDTDSTPKNHKKWLEHVRSEIEFHKRTTRMISHA